MKRLFWSDTTATVSPSLCTLLAGFEALIAVAALAFATTVAAGAVSVEEFKQYASKREAALGSVIYTDPSINVHLSSGNLSAGECPPDGATLIGLVKPVDANAQILETEPFVTDDAIRAMSPEESLKLRRMPSPAALAFYTDRVLPLITKACPDFAEVMIKLAFYDIVRIGEGLPPGQASYYDLARFRLVRQSDGKWTLSIGGYFPIDYFLSLKTYTAFGGNENRVWPDQFSGDLPGIERKPGDYWNGFKTLKPTGQVFEGRKIGLDSYPRQTFEALIQGYERACSAELAGKSVAVSFPTERREEHRRLDGGLDVTIIHGRTRPVMVLERYAGTYSSNHDKITVLVEWKDLENDVAHFIKENGCASKSVSQLMENYYRMLESMPSLQEEALQKRGKAQA